MTLVREIYQKSRGHHRKSDVRDLVTLTSAITGAALFLAVPEFGIPMAVAAAGFGLLSAGSAFTKPKKPPTPGTLYGANVAKNVLQKPPAP